MEAVMNVFRSLVIALSLYTRIPMPRIEWQKESMRYTMAFFPLAGVAVGLVILFWNWLSLALGAGPLLRGAVFAFIPLIVAGAIHMDGFCDTVDALASNADPEKKREILHDPHAGAFAAIGSATYVVAFAAFASEFDARWHLVCAFACFFVFSRCCSGIATIAFPYAEGSAMVSAFADAASKKAVVIVLTIFGALSAVAIGWFAGFSGAIAIVAALVVLILCRGWLIHLFDGFSGDLAGWLLQVIELVALIALIVADKVFLVAF